ncbi:MAG: GntR family transcriptional regulator [Paenibacillaceae bacterium]
MKKLLYNEISDQIERKINEGIYSEGKKLPSERLLSDEYGVSRNVIREAVRLLSEKGLLEIKPGKGIYVISPNGEMITDAIKRVLQTKGATLHEMLEVREALETSVIKLLSGLQMRIFKH